MRKEVVARAPGKLILSGEYSVLYKMPAIAFAVDKFTETISFVIDEDFVVIELKDYNFAIRLSSGDVTKRYLNTLDRYNDFLLGALPIERVLESPVDLCCFVIKKISGKDSGIKISIASNIPIASGFGSSAALIVSLMTSLEGLFNLSLTKEEFYKLALESENLVHGNSSGIDVMTSMIGGCNYFYGGNVSMNLLEGELFSVFTGMPEVSTGESIAKVKSLLNTPTRLDEFKEVTLGLKEAIENKDMNMVIRQIRNNHTLLKELGVVPLRVQSFIEEVESSKGAAKICGSGAASSDNAGVVIALGRFEHISKFAEKFGYNCEKIIQSDRGAYVL
jgi:mevalonate kinase